MRKEGWGVLKRGRAWHCQIGKVYSEMSSEVVQGCDRQRLTGVRSRILACSRPPVVPGDP